MESREPLRGAVDIHIHLAGAAPAGASAFSPSGCYIHPRRWSSLAFRAMRWSLGISRAEEADPEAAIRERLFRYLDGAPSLAAAVVLALDWARDGRGAPLPGQTDLYVPNDYALSVARAHPKLRAGVSIHPFRPDALEELHRTARAGAVLVKWLPTAQNIPLGDERCRHFARELAALGLPLLCHTGSEGATRQFNKAWNNPRALEPLLREGATVIAAHAGMRSGPHEPDYYPEWLALCRDFSNLYGDTAAWMALRARNAFRVLEDPRALQRLIHGSDWPVPTSPWWHLFRLPLREIRALARLRNPLERDIATKRALGLPDEIFTRAARVLVPLRDGFPVAAGDGSGTIAGGTADAMGRRDALAD